MPPVRLRKIIKRQDRYVCGMCRRAYASSDEAEGCLKMCLETFFEHDPVRRKRQVVKVNYQCLLCMRGYKDYQEAVDCAEDCKSRDLGKSNLSDDDIASLIQVIPRVRRKVAKVNVAYVSKFGKKGSQEEVADATEAEEVFEEEPQIVEDAPVEEAAPKPQKSDFKSPWYRDDAKYGCSFCKEIHWTRMEATQCFDAHFEEGGQDETAA